jgi:hypothetical protein
MSMRMQRLVLAAAVAGCALLLPAGPALAGAGTSHPDAATFHNAVETFADTVPCHDDLGGYLITTTYNGQLHSTANDNGFWITGTETGTFAASPIQVETDSQGNLVRDPDSGNLIPIVDASGNPIPRDGESFSGKFTDWFGASINRNESVLTETFNIHGVGSAGTSFAAHDNGHVVTDGAGDPFDPNTPLKLAFDHSTCG